MTTRLESASIRAGKSLPTAADLDAIADEQRIAQLTGEPARPSAVLPPTPDEIDTEISFYNNAAECLKAAQKTCDDYKARLVFLADHFGARPEGAEQSLRLSGRRNTLTSPAALRSRSTSRPSAISRAISASWACPSSSSSSPRKTTHKLVEGARSLLKKLSMPRRAEERVLALLQVHRREGQSAGGQGRGHQAREAEAPAEGRKEGRLMAHHHHVALIIAKLAIVAAAAVASSRIDHSQRVQLTLHAPQRSPAHPITR